MWRLEMDCLLTFSQTLFFSFFLSPWTGQNNIRKILPRAMPDHLFKLACYVFEFINL